MFRAETFLAALIGVATTAVCTSVPRSPTPANKAFALSLPAANIAKASSASAIPRSGGRSIVRDDDGLFYVDAQVNGKTVRFLVDTGSNIVVLTASDATRAGISHANNDAGAMQTAGGTARIQSATISKIVIAGQALDDVDAVTINNGMTVSLLGQSALSRLRSIRFVGDRLDLN